MPHEAFVAKAKAVLASDARVLAAYLVGGFAVGIGDAFSDIDRQIVVTDEAADELAQAWPDLIHELAPTVWIQPFGNLSPNAPHRGPVGGICITPEWLHFDIVIRAAATLEGHAIEGVVPLLDKAGLLPSEPTPRPDRRGDPLFPEAKVWMFLYMLGNVVAAIGRNEPIPASNGVIMMRDIGFVGLLLAEQGLTTTRENTVGNPFPFTKRLRRYLTDEQNALLESLPPVAPSIESAIDGFVALAEIFIPRAKRLCGGHRHTLASEVRAGERLVLREERRRAAGSVRTVYRATSGRASAFRPGRRSARARHSVLLSPGSTGLGATRQTVAIRRKRVSAGGHRLVLDAGGRKRLHR